MSMLNKTLKCIAKHGLLLMMGLSMSACAGLSGHSKGWKEEVELHDGRVLVVERHFNLDGYRTLDARERALLDETISFTLPETGKTISWKTEFDDSVSEPNSLGPLLLDIVDDVPYLATSPAGCISYNKWGRPNPPYVLFKYVNEEWKRIPLDEFPAELVHSNLMSTPDSRILKSYYTVEQAKGQMQGRNIAAYAKTILREPVRRRCPKLIPYGRGGWLGLDWFTDQPSLEACIRFCDKKKVNADVCPCNSIFKGK